MKISMLTFVVDIRIGILGTFVYGRYCRWWYFPFLSINNSRLQILEDTKTKILFRR